MDSIREFITLVSLILSFADIFAAMSFIGKGNHRIVTAAGCIFTALFWYLAASWHYMSLNARCITGRISLAAALAAFCLAVSAWKYRKKCIR